MQDMRYLYGMPKTASARREEFVGNLRNYFGSLRIDGMPVKTASEKRAVVAGLLTKYAGGASTVPTVKPVTQTTNGSGQKVNRTVTKVSFPDASPEEKARRLASVKAKQDAAQAAADKRNAAAGSSAPSAQRWNANSAWALRKALTSN